MSAHDARSLRDAFGCLMTGVTIVTATQNGKPLGFRANSFSSLSLDTPLLLVPITNHSANLATFVAMQAWRSTSSA